MTRCIVRGQGQGHGQSVRAAARSAGACPRPSAPRLCVTCVSVLRVASRAPRLCLRASAPEPRRPRLCIQRSCIFLKIRAGRRRTAGVVPPLRRGVGHQPSAEERSGEKRSCIPLGVAQRLCSAEPLRADGYARVTAPPPTSPYRAASLRWTMTRRSCTRRACTRRRGGAAARPSARDSRRRASTAGAQDENR